MTEQTPAEQKRIERNELKVRNPIIEEIARKDLLGTALTEKKTWEESDIKAIRSFFIEAAPYAHTKIASSFWDHILITSVYAKLIAEKTGVLPPLEAEALGFMHDCGKMENPRYMLADVLDNILNRKIGIREDIQSEFTSVPGLLGITKGLRWLGVGKPVESMEDLSPAQRILEIADNLGKRNLKGNLISLGEWREYVLGQTKRYEGHVWATERRGLKAYGEKKEFEIDLVGKEVKWLEKQGVDFKKLGTEVEAEFYSKRNQKWLLAVKDSQESLDPKIDEDLKRKPITTIVFDIGAVLFYDSESDLVTKIASYFNTSPEEINKLFAELNPKAMGDDIGEKEYLERFYSTFGKNMPKNIEEARKPFVNPEIYRPIEEMQRLVKELADNNVQIFILSNSIRPVAEIVLKKLTEFYPQIDREKSFISSYIGGSKANGPAFKKFLEITGIDPKTALFIDNIQAYADNARIFGNGMRSMMYRENHFKKISAYEKLERELKKAGLISRNPTPINHPHD